MATSSITSNIVIDDKMKAEQFIKALEDSMIDLTKEEKKKHNESKRKLYTKIS